MFEELKEFIQSQEKQGYLIRLPEDNTNILLGFATPFKHFFIYEIFDRRISRTFHLANPELLKGEVDELGKERPKILKCNLKDIKALEISPYGSYMCASVGPYVFL